METWQIAITSSLLTFIATLTVAWLGYRQWKVNRESENRKSYAADKAAKYRELWGLVEDIHVKIRVSRPSTEELKSLDQTLNSFRLRNGIYLDRDVLALSNEYFNSIRDLYLFVIEQGVEEDIERFAATAPIPYEITVATLQLSSLNKDMEMKREALIQKVKKALNADAP